MPKFSRHIAVSCKRWAPAHKTLWHAHDRATRTGRLALKPLSSVEITYSLLRNIERFKNVRPRIDLYKEDQGAERTIVFYAVYLHKLGQALLYNSAETGTAVGKKARVIHLLSQDHNSASPVHHQRKPPTTGMPLYSKKKICFSTRMWMHRTYLLLL